MLTLKDYKKIVELAELGYEVKFQEWAEACHKLKKAENNFDTTMKELGELRKAEKKANIEKLESYNALYEFKKEDKISLSFYK